MGKLFVGLDFFHAGSYGPDETAPETIDYAHDKNRLYLVLQPFLVDSGPDAVALAEYLSWPGDRLREPGRLAIAEPGPALAGLAKTPVPFPPGTELRLEMSWEPGGGSFSAARTLGRWQADGVQTALPADPLLLAPGAPIDDPLVLPRGQWPDFAIHSFARPLVARWHHLASAQQDELLSWVCALAPYLRKEGREAKDGTLLQRIYREYAKETPLGEERGVDDLKSHLATGAIPVIAKLYEDLIENARQSEPSLHPPRFPFELEQLRQHPEALLPDHPPAYLVTAYSYHRRLWEKLGDVLKVAPRAEHTPDQARDEAIDREHQAALALGRLFGFGERLRWPRRDDLAGFKNHFMMLRQNAEAPAPPGWFVTNAHSLLGQVFGIGPIEPAAPLASLRLQALTVQGIDLLNGTAPGDTPGEVIQRSERFERDLHTFHSAVSQSQGRLFKARLRREGELTLYGPKMALGQREAALSPAGKLLFSVPGVLLDALEPAARTEMPAAEESDKAALLRRNPQRTALTAKDLFHPEILLPSTDPPWRTLFQLRVKVARHAVTGSAVPLFEVMLAGEAHPLEKEALSSLLNAIPARTAELWIAPAAGGPPTACPVSQVLAREDRGGLPVLLVPDLPDTKGKILLSVLLDGAQRGGNGEAAADLVFATRGDEPFNLLERQADVPETEKEGGPLFVLNRSLNTRIGLSAEQLAERFGLTLSPSPFVGGMEQRQHRDPVLDHAANFNKLRIGLRHGAEQIKIHHPDAVLPLSLQPSDPQQPARPWNASRPLDPDHGPHFDYWLAHQFDQEVRDDAGETESGRFLAFVTAGRSWDIEGHVEHQYSHRIPVTGGASVKLGRSTEVANLGGLAFRGRLAAEPVQDNEGKDVPAPLREAIAYDHRKPAAGPEILAVQFRRKAFQLALERFAGIGTTASEGKTAWLRQIYEGLADLRSALELEGTAELWVERWSFDNRGGGSLEATNEHGEVAVLGPRMRRMEKGVFDLKQLPAAERAELDGVLSLLDQTFVNFRAALATRVGPGIAGDDDGWLSLDIPLTRDTAGWRWTGIVGDPVSKTTDAIRVALHLRRPPGVVVPKSVGTATLLPMDLEDQGDVPALAAEISRLRPLVGSLEGTARGELKEWLSPKPEGFSPLLESFAWLRSEDLDRKIDPQHTHQLFGEVSPFLNFPTDLRQNVDRVVDLYYVPFAFVPLRPHPAFGDAQTTQEFAQYLITLLEDIAQGRPLGSRLGLEPAVLPAEEALRLRNKVRGIIRDPGNGRKSVARLLLDLLDQVDDRKGMRKWPDEKEKKLFEEVQTQLDALNDQKLGEQRLEAARLDLLARHPGLYARARAIAVGVFKPETWSEQLYALQLHKRIREDLPREATDGLERFEQELFTYLHFLGKDNRRYLLDVLEEGRYDNELEILPSRYRDETASDTSRLSEIRSLAATPLARRGDAQARRAEDLLERVHDFTPPDPAIVHPAHRSIEVNVVHYNPEWRTRRKNTREVTNWSYILPSRRFPAVPKPVLPTPSRDAAGADNPWRSPLIPTFPESGPINLEAAFTAAMNEVLDARKDVSLAAAIENGRAIPARRVDDTLALLDAGKATGWHFLETWLTHFYFVVEAGDAEQRILDTLSNDVFEIETEVWATQPPAPAAPKILPDLEAVSPLQQWFTYDRRLRQGTPGAGVTSPPGVSLDKVLEEMEEWLVGFPGPAPANSVSRGEVLLQRLHPVGDAEAASADAPLGGTVMLFSRAGDDWSLVPDKKADGADRWTLPDGNAVGGVLAAEVMELLDGETNQPRKGTFLIRVSVLDSPWRYVRARLRVRRNARDVDGNHDADVNESFVMMTEHSDWVTFGRHVLALGPNDFARYRLPEKVRQLEVSKAGDGISLQQWLHGPQDTVSFGPLLQRAVPEADFIDAQHKQQFFWDRLAATDEHKVAGILLQELEDAAPRKSLSGVAQDIPERRDLIARQHLPRVDANQLGTLTEKIRRDLVLTDSPLLKATWFNKANEAVLDVTWPIEILPK